MKIKSVLIIEKYYRCKTYNYRYSSAQVYINFGLKTEKKLYIPKRYGDVHSTAIERAKELDFNVFADGSTVRIKSIVIKSTATDVKNWGKK